jgi:hypothetical protein
MFSPTLALIRSCAMVVATALGVVLLAPPVAAAAGVYGAWMLLRAGVRWVRRDERAAPTRVVRLPLPRPGALALQPVGDLSFGQRGRGADRSFVGARGPVLRLPMVRPRWCIGPSLMTADGEPRRGHGAESRRNPRCRRPRQDGRRGAPGV